MCGDIDLDLKSFEDGDICEHCESDLGIADSESQEEEDFDDL